MLDEDANDILQHVEEGDNAVYPKTSLDAIDGDNLLT
jgi:hypothetical protein